MLIFEKSGAIAPNDDKTNIILPFDVPDNIEKIVIDYTYFPKTANCDERAVKLIEQALNKYSVQANPQEYLPVKNLITLSLDDTESYRGAAHRQAECQHHEIGINNASPGFIKGKIHSGRWRLVLNVHCCVCDVKYSIKISGEENK